MDDKEQVAETAARLRRAILTLYKVPDPDSRFVYGSGTYWPEFVHELNQAEKPSVLKTFKPSPKDIDTYLETLKGLTWLQAQNDGKRDCRIIVARAFETPWWWLAAKHGRHRSTVTRWYEGAVATIWSFEKRLKTAK